MSAASSRRRQPIRIALLLSFAAHVVAAAVLVLLMQVEPQRPAISQGDSLMVELSQVEEPKPGTPAGRDAVESSPAAPPAPRRQAPPSPPRPPVKAPPAARPEPPAPRVAAAPTPPPAPTPQAIPPPAPAPAPAPVPTPDTATASPAPAPTATPTPDSGRAAGPPQQPSSPPASEPRVAAVPGDGGAGPGGRGGPDLRSLRGSGGVGTGKGGIEGEPIPLNSDDPNLADYLQRVKRAIERHWAVPCIKNPQTGECEGRNVDFLVEFGILRSGKLQYVVLRRTSGLVPYDESAMTAIKLASPFPSVPPALMAKSKVGSTGVPILGHFHITYEVSFRTLLR